MESKGTGGKFGSYIIFKSAKIHKQETYKLSQADMETLVDEYVDSMTDEVKGFTNFHALSKIMYSNVQLEQQ